MTVSLNTLEPKISDTFVNSFIKSSTFPARHGQIRKTAFPSRHAKTRAFPLRERPRSSRAVFLCSIPYTNPSGKASGNEKTGIFSVQTAFHRNFYCISVTIHSRFSSFPLYLKKQIAVGGHGPHVLGYQHLQPVHRMAQGLHGGHHHILDIDGALPAFRLRSSGIRHLGQFL